MQVALGVRPRDFIELFIKRIKTLARTVLEQEVQ
jgi:hypothetical protein